MTSIRLANPSDFEKVMQLIKSCKTQMVQLKIHQWAGNYPYPETIKEAIQKKELYVLSNDKNKLLGTITLNEEQEEVYQNVSWLSNNKLNLVIHRLAINPAFEGQGLAQKLMKFAEEFAISKTYHSIRLDTFSLNTRSQKFYEKQGFTKTGSIKLLGRPEPYFCYEKILSSLSK